MRLLMKIQRPVAPDTSSPLLLYDESRKHEFILGQNKVVMEWMGNDFKCFAYVNTGDGVLDIEYIKLVDPGW